jgi:hypothetical protein
MRLDMRAQHIFPRLLILVSILLVTLAPVGVVSAAPPVIENGTWESDGPLYIQPCPGFVLWDHEVGTYHLTSYFDNQGNLTAAKVHFQATDNFYNPDNPGVVLSGLFNVTAEVDLQTGDLINMSGLDVHITIPGYGRVAFLTGHWLRYPDIQLGGLDSFQNPKDMAVFCSMLAGQ